MIKPHIKVIQRNGVDIFVTSSIKYKLHCPSNPYQMGSVTNEDLRNIGQMHKRLGSLGDESSVHRLDQITLDSNRAAQGGTYL